MGDILKLDQSKRSKLVRKKRGNKPAKVIIAEVVTTLDTPADRLLESAIGRLDECIIVGTDKEGNDFFASNRSDAGTAIYHFERAKHRLMKLIDEA